MRVKLTSEIAEVIRARIAGGELHKLLAYEYGVGKSTISMIATGKIWKCPPSNPSADRQEKATTITAPQASTCSPPSRQCLSLSGSSENGRQLAFQLTEA